MVNSGAKIRTLDVQKEITYTEITAASSSFTTIADVSGLSISFTLTETRTVELRSCCLVRSTVAADTIELSLTDSSNTLQMNSGGIYIPTANGSVRQFFAVRKSLAAGSYTYKIRAARLSGSGTTVVNATSTSPSYIQALDVT